MCTNLNIRKGDTCISIGVIVSGKFGSCIEPDPRKGYVLHAVTEGAFIYIFC